MSAAAQAAVCLWCDSPSPSEDLGKDGMCIQCYIHFDSYTPPKTTSYTSTNYSSTGTSYQSCCHDGKDVYVMEPVIDGAKRKITVSAAQGWRAGAGMFTEGRPVDIVLDTADTMKASDFTPQFVKEGPPKAMALNSLFPSKGGKVPQWIRLNWPDMKAPPGNPPAKFWRGVVSLVPDQGRLMVVCVGAHGRTGTTLCAILISLCGYTAFDAVTFVRKEHCKDAVETKDQMEYLQWLEAQVAEEIAAATPTPTKKGKKK